MIARSLAVVLLFAGTAAAQPRVSREPLDLAGAMRFVWAHPSGDREVSVQIDRDRGPCVVRVGRQRIGDVGVSGVYFDEEQHVAGSCYGSAWLVDDDDLVVELGTAFADAGEPGSSALLLLTRDAQGNAALLARGGRDERVLRWYDGHGSAEAIARARDACAQAEGDALERAWARLEMLRATPIERGACAARYVQTAARASCAGREAGDELQCWNQQVDRLGRLLGQPALAEHERALRDAAHDAGRAIERAILRALEALPLLTADNPEVFVRRADALEVYTSSNWRLLELYGYRAEAAWLDRDRAHAESLVRCLAATDTTQADSFRRQLASAHPTLLERCEEHLREISP